VTTIGLVMVAAAAVGALFLYLQRWLLIGNSRRVEYDLRTDLFGHVQRLDLAYFGETKTGDLMARFTNDLNALRDVVGPGLMYAVSMTVTLVLSIALMLAIDPKLTLIAFAPYPLISLVTFRFGRAIYPRSRRVQDIFGALSARAQEDLTGTRVIRAYVQEESCARIFERLNQEYLEANMDVARLRGRFMAAMGALAGSGLALALWFGGREVVRGNLSLGSLVAFSAYLAELTWPVIAVGFVISMLQRGAGAAARIETVLETEPAITTGAVAGRPQPRVRFEHVSFRYPGAAVDALTDVSFALEPGQTLGIVGRTGSGKSTILKLLLRLYDPTGGRVLLDEVDLRERDLTAARAIIGYAPQDAFLYSRSLKENIAFGEPEATPERVVAASERARLASDLAQFPQGLDTLIGERGVTLSGGQRQRVSLARALLLEPDLLLLDDTLSSVDAETETAILRELKPIVAARTTIIVSHRISAVQDSDWILVCDDGRVIDEGRHAELITRSGLYARLYERQRLAAEIEDVR
jgi:ATP-binding cassette, subfamily B, multidrug efflux pump